MSIFNQLKNVVPKLWNDKVTIIGYQDIKHGAITDSEKVIIVKDEPAKVVLKSQKASEQSFFGTDNYDAELLIRNGINIPAGADIWVTDQNGITTKYKRSSKGYTGYYSHQEITMVRDEKS